MAQNDVSDTTISHYSWKLDNNFSRVVRTEHDTSLVDFQVYDPIYQESISNTYLGVIGTAYISNDFSRQLQEYPFFPAQAFSAYFYSPENAEYYNTKLPITRLYYSDGGSKENKENSLKVLHTQNINPNLNFGLNYYLISSRGQFKFTNVKNHAFRLFGSFTKPKYKAHFNYNLNRYQNGESGGIVDSIFKNSEYQFPKEVSTVFSGTGSPNYSADASNQIRYFDLMLSQNIRLFRVASKMDSTRSIDNGSMAEPVFGHVVRFYRYTKVYKHENPLENPFYPIAYINPEQTYDSVAKKTLTNTFQLEFKTLIRKKIQTGIFVHLKNELNWYNYNTPADENFVFDPADTSVIQQLFQYYIYTNGDTLFPVNEEQFVVNNYITGGIYGDFWKTISGAFTASLAFNGYKAGETKLNGMINTKFKVGKHDYLINGSLTIENRIPDYFYNYYYSNHFIWENSFQPVLLTHLSGSFQGLSNYIKLQGNYTLLRNVIYFNSVARPDQYDQTISVFSLHFKKRLKFWKFYSMNEMMYQVTDNPDIISIPEFAYRNASYFWHTFNFRSTGGQLEVMLGVELYYHTLYYSKAYMPALAQFYQQEEYKTGNFPVINFFLNLHLKRANFFGKVEHVNSDWWNKNYFSTVHYPKGERMFKFGISWSFFD